MNKEQEEFNEINNIVSKTINILSDEDFCKLWEYILNKRHQLKEIENKIFGLDELEYYKREVIYKRKVIKDQQEEIERLNNIINELEKDIQKEIERTNNLILEDSSMVEINNIRRMLNETRQCILFKLKKLKGE